MHLTATIDPTPWMQHLDAIKTQAISKAIVRTLNRQVKSSRKDVRKQVSKMAGVKAMRIQKVMKLHYASRGKYVSKIEIRDAWIKLSYFRTRKLKKGIRAKVWGRSQFYPGTFRVTMPSGHVGIFKPWDRKLGPRVRWRKTKTGRTKKGQGVQVMKGRGIKELWGPAIPREFSKMLKQGYTKEVQNKMQKEFVRNLEFYIKQAK